MRVAYRVGVLCRGEYVLGYAGYRRHWSKSGKPGRVLRHRIVIDSRLPLGEKWDVLIHEWAHCLDRETRPKRPKDCHDARWGQCYSKAFKASLP